MSHELICSCLQLSPDKWPPDYYTLLGLEPGEANRQRIEQHVQERMEKLRGYQLTHAEQATEGMNRLAQALVCLTDPVAKQAYDAKLAARRSKRPARRAAHAGPPRPNPAPIPRLDSRSRARWLLLAWLVWLSVGLIGLVAIVHYFPAIRESYQGVREGVFVSSPVPRAGRR